MCRTSWLPYDNMRVNVNGVDLPLYKVHTPQGVQELALLGVQEGTWTFVDPQAPGQTVTLTYHQGDPNPPEPVMHMYVLFNNFLGWGDTFLWAWNDFTGPLLFLNSPRNYTMALGLQDFQGQHTMVWNQMMAAAVMFTVPIIVAYFFAQKTFIQGIKMTGMKE